MAKKIIGSLKLQVKAGKPTRRRPSARPWVSAA
jgi:hypothetical protein